MYQNLCYNDILHGDFGALTFTNSTPSSLTPLTPMPLLAKTNIPTPQTKVTVNNLTQNHEKHGQDQQQV